MDSSDASKLLILFILLLFSAFFSSAETCLTTVNKMRLKSMADEGNKKAALVLKLISNQTKMLSSILIGNNIVNLSASSLATTFAINLAKKSGFSNATSLITGAATGIITILVIIFGEILPKSIATMNADKMSLIYSKPIYTLTVILGPFAYIFDKFSKLLLKIFHIDITKQPAITENELRTIVDVSHKEGVIESEERQMITNVVDFGDSLAKDVMVPKMDVEFVELSLTYDELIESYSKEKFTRMPVYDDSRDNVVGIINLKDIFFYQGDKKDFKISDVMREAYFTYEYKKISELFFEMKEASIPMAIVLDEYGSTSGILTIEDLIEEIVGEAVGRIRKRFPDSVVNVSVPEEMLIVPMDATLIEQVLINLMENHIFIPKHFLLLDTRRLCLAEQSDP